MEPGEHDSIDSDHEEHESSLVRHGEVGKRGRYSYSKCTTCRKKKKKCEPPNRVWPSKCNRCLGLDLDCSPPEDLRERTTSLTLPHSPRIENGKIVKFQRPPRTATSSTASPTTATHHSPENPTFPQALGHPPYPNPDLPLHLCGKCELLELSPARFLIPDRSWRVNGRSGQSLGWQLAGEYSSPWSPGINAHGAGPGAGVPSGAAKSPNTRHRVQLGSLKDIKESCIKCSFCLLVWWSAADQLILRGEGPERLGEYDQKSLNSLCYATWEIDGRERVPFPGGRFYQPVTRHIRLSWETSNSDLDLKDAYVVLCGDNPNDVGLDQAFLGRSIPSTVGSELDYKTMKGWISHCDFHHGSCRPRTLLQAVPLRSSEGIRVIDVKDLKLVPWTEGMEYVALSYTWSDTRGLLSKDSFESWQKTGLNENDLAQDIRRTIQVVRQLGKPYLWVDSLCIIHDHLEDKNKHYAIIDRIFANASLTICAARLSRATHTVRQHIIRGLNMSLMVHHPLQTYIRDSPWSKGAWTCQDRLLSGRCLIFTDTGRVWFQCQKESKSQDIFESSYRGYSADMVQNPVQIWKELQGRTSEYRAYIKGVEFYTLRTLPQPDHALRAFEGISNFLSANFKTTFFRGLPSVYLDMALLWTSATGDAERRTIRGRPVAPSWSWAGWSGNATYRAPILAGAVENIWDWLKDHTWITWYLVDYKGPLGQIGTYATGELAKRAEGRKPCPNKTADGDDRVVAKRTDIRWPGRNRTMFFKTVTEPERDPDQMDEGDDSTVALPPPYFLQFWTWSATFQLCPAWTGGQDRQTASRQQVPAPTIRRFNILDCNRDICGTIVLTNEIADRVEQDQDAMYEFIALSDAKDFRDDEMQEWTYYIPKKREDSFWDLWYVLLLEKDGIKGVSRRLGLGKVFKDAFHQSFQSGMEWREFILS